MSETKRFGNRRRVMKRGGSYTVTIPAVFAAQLGIKDGSIVEIETNGRELILRVVGYKEPKRKGEKDVGLATSGEQNK